MTSSDHCIVTLEVAQVGQGKSKLIWGFRRLSTELLKHERFIVIAQSRFHCLNDEHVALFERWEFFSPQNKNEPRQKWQLQLWFKCECVRRDFKIFSTSMSFLMWQTRCWCSGQCTCESPNKSDMGRPPSKSNDPSACRQVYRLGKTHEAHVTSRKGAILQEIITFNMILSLLNKDRIVSNICRIF